MSIIGTTVHNRHGARYKVLGIEWAEHNGGKVASVHMWDGADVWVPVSMFAVEFTLAEVMS